MGIIVPVASGKGGVGKTVFAANLGAALAVSGRAVVVVDLDLGGANLHSYLGMYNRHAGIGAFVWKKEKSLEALAAPTPVDRLFMIAGDNLLPGVANLDFPTKQRIIKGLSELAADYVILDLGAGTSHNVVDFWLLAPDGIIVTAPEIPSVLNAYAFLKNAAYRALFRALPKGGGGREALAAFVAARPEGRGPTLLDFAAKLVADGVEGAESALVRLRSLRPRAVVNLGSGQDDTVMAARLQDIVSRNLGMGLEFLAYIMRDPSVPASLPARSPLFLTAPDAPFVRGVKTAAERLVRAVPTAGPRLDLDDDDLSIMVERKLQSEDKPAY